MLIKISTLLLMLSITLSAAPVLNTQFSFRQPDGSIVPVLVSGDEFYQEVSSLDGYSLVRDSEGWICYAELNFDSSQLIPTERYTGQSNWSRNSTPNIRLSDRSIAAEVEKNRMLLGFGNNNSRAKTPANYRQPSGAVTGLTLVINFPDKQSSKSLTQINNFLNGENYSDDGTNGSVREWFAEVSEGILDYTNIVYGTYTAKNNFSYYDDPNITYGSRAKELVKEALSAADAAGFDFSQLTLIEETPMLNVLYAGEPESGWSKGLWAHKGYMSGVTHDGISFPTYQISGISTTPKLSTFTHETGHLLLNYEDLYNFAGSEWRQTVNRYCVMGMGGAYSPTNPTPYNPYFRHVAGWITPTDLTGQTDRTIQVNPNHMGHVHYVHNSDYTERYYIDARTDSGRSSQFPQSGIVVWRINQAGDSKRGPIALVEVVDQDGDLSYASDDYDDIFVDMPGEAFGSNTVPHSNWYDGSASGLDIRNISDYGSTMTYDLGTGGTIVTPDSFSIQITAQNGQVDRSPDQAKYEDNSIISLTATPETGYEFTGWSGDVTGSENPLQVAMTADLSVTAHFGAITPDSVTLTIAAENGIIEGNPHGSRFEKGSTVTLTATPNEDHFFVSWFGDTTTSEPTIDLTLHENTSLNAYCYPVSFPDTNVIAKGSWTISAGGVSGSEGSIDSSQFESEYRLSAELSVTKDESYESYASLAAFFDGDFSNLESIELTYTASKEIWLEISDDVTYNNPPVYYTLTASDTPKAVIIPASALNTRADWGTNYSDPLDLSKVSTISFNIVGSDDIASNSVSGTISISDITLNGFIEQAVNVSGTAANVQALRAYSSNNKLHLSLPRATATAISIWTVSGRKISSFNTGKLNAGVHTIALDNCAAGIYFMRVSNEIGVINQKVVLER